MRMFGNSRSNEMLNAFASGYDRITDPSGFIMKFNQDISNWNTGKVETLRAMFQNNAYFNQDISEWDTSNVESMVNMFWGAYNFNNGQNASESTAPLNWNTTKVGEMSGMFGLYRYAFEEDRYGAEGYDKTTDPSGLIMKFNQDISNWNTGKVSTFKYMFQHNEYFNQDISGWDVSS